jgi:UV DNA damage endonuclease
MGKRKIHAIVTHAPPEYVPPALVPQPNGEPPRKQRASRRKVSRQQSVPLLVDPDQSANVLDGAEAWRASPDADERMDVEQAGMNAGKQIKEEDERTRLLCGTRSDSGSSLSELSDVEGRIKTTGVLKAGKVASVIADAASGQEKSGKGVVSRTAAGQPKVATEAPQFLDPEEDGEEEPDEEELQAAFSRPPPVNSGYLPLPWKGRLGYVRCNIFSCVIPI